MIWIEAKPFTRAADPGKIIAAVKGAHQALDSIHQPRNTIGEQRPPRWGFLLLAQPTQGNVTDSRRDDL
jgi:hypothetical protein